MRGEEVAKVEDFKYLGSTVRGSGECGGGGWGRECGRDGVGGEECRE